MLNLILKDLRKLIFCRLNALAEKLGYFLFAFPENTNILELMAWNSFEKVWNQDRQDSSKFKLRTKPVFFSKITLFLLLADDSRAHIFPFLIFVQVASDHMTSVR